MTSTGKGGSRGYDVVIWGATGFTGRLISQYFIKNYPASSETKFALAGRNEQKLLELRLACGRTCNCSVGHVDIMVASLDDPASLDRLAASARVVLAAAGPFDVLGTPVVDACVRQGTNYVDITGETQWYRKIIDKHHEEAARKRIKIVPCCGFDCIPADMSCYFMVDALKKHNLIPEEVRFVMDDASGTFSNGTCSTMLHLFGSSSVHTLLSLLNPYCLNPVDTTGSIVSPGGVLQAFAASDKSLPEYEKVFRYWTIPYIMQGIDTRLVNRANALSGWAYGRGFVFSERMKVDNIFLAVLASLLIPFVGLLMFFSPTRTLLQRVIPAPGQGPSVDVQNHGYFKVRLWGRGRDVATGRRRVITGGMEAMHGDPGYLQCSRMVSEAALCLAAEARAAATNGKSPAGDDDDHGSSYGVVPPSVAFKQNLLDKLQAINIKLYLDRT